MNKKMKKFFGSKKFTSIILPIILIIILGAIAYFSFASSDESIDETEAQLKSERFINDFLMDGGKATVKNIDKEYGLYKLKIDIDSEELIDAYITNDGKIFFPQSMDIDMISSEESEDNKKYSEDEIEIRAKKFINEYLMDGGKAVIKNINKEYGLYKLSVDVGVEDLADSYITMDGKLFFPQALIIEKIYEEDKNSIDTTKINEVEKKNIRPQVKLFVMSHCPYGTQMEKAIIPVVRTLGNSIDFDIKFNTYAMHGKSELEEQMAQYCLMEEQEDKYLNYLECFLVDGDTNRCLTETNINKSSLNNCLSKAEEKYNVISDFENIKNYQGDYPGFAIHEDDNYKYGVSGSPMLVINGQTIYSERNPGSLLNVICSAFITKPEACDESLSTNSPEPGFGEKSSASSIEGSCN
jgi:predicted hydrocarbon binding protein